MVNRTTTNGQSLQNQLLDGRYRIIEVIEASEFGHTYLAKDIRRPGEPICFVKHLQPSSYDPKLIDSARRLFVKEAEVLERLGQHNQIPQLFAYFEENQEFYLVEAYIAGHALSNEISPGYPLPESQVINILKQILEVLVFVHGHGVIHRDIKPDNIVRRQSDNKLVLIDFGAVKLIPSLTQEINPRTMRVGTLEYMPLEQFEYNPQLNSDIYAVGMMAIQLLTGLPAYELPKLREINGHSKGEIKWRHLAVMSEELANIIDKMIRHDYRNRYQSSQAVLVDLQKINARPIDRSSIIATYREEVKRCASHRGEITVVGKQILAELKSSLEITDEEAEKIEDEILNPYRKSKEKGERYAIAFADAIKQEYPPNKDTREELKRLKQLLALNDEDVKFIENQVRPSSWTDKMYGLLRAFLQDNSSNSKQNMGPLPSIIEAQNQDNLNGANFRNHQLINNNNGTLNGQVKNQGETSGKRSLNKPIIAAGTVIVLGLIGAISGYREWQKSEKLRQLEIQTIKVGNTLYQQSKYEDCLQELTVIPESSQIYSIAQELNGKCQGGINWKNVQVRSLGQNTGEMSSLVFTPDGLTLASGNKNKTAQIWDISTGSLKRNFIGDNSKVWSVALNSKATYLAGGTADWRVLIWNLITGEIIRTVEHTATIWSVAFSPNDQLIASGSSDNTIKVWQVESGELIYDLLGHKDYVYSVAISADGKTLVSGSQDKTVKVWDLGTGNLIYTLNGHTAGVRSVAISPDNKTIVSCSYDGTLKIWNLRTGELIHTLTGHIGGIVAVAISDDSTLIASGGKDRTVKIWNLATGVLVNTLNGHTDEVHTVTFSPDGKSIASGGKDRTILLWQR